MKRILTGAFVLVLGLAAQAQDFALLKKADKAFDKGDYLPASEAYTQYLKGDADNPLALFKLGICEVNLSIPRKALANLKLAKSLGGQDFPPVYHYWLGRAYHLSYKVDSALMSYRIFVRNLGDSKDPYKMAAHRYIAEAHRGRSFFLAERPPVLVETMGEGINTHYTEGHPLLTRDGAHLFFTTRRPSTPNEPSFSDGEHLNKVYWAQADENGSFAKPKWLNLGTRPGFHLICLQVLPGERLLLLETDYKGKAHFLISERSESGWKQGVRTDLGIDPTLFETDGTFSPDLATAYYSEIGTRTEYSLQSWQKKDGRWENQPWMVEDLASEEDEVAPYLADSLTLFFASKRAEGFGGFDIYKSVYNPYAKRWTSPINLGFPINSPGNDLYYSQSAFVNGRQVRVVAAERPESMGKTDLFLLKPANRYSLAGAVKNEEGAPLASALIQVFSLDGQLITKAYSDAEGKYDLTFFLDEKKVRIQATLDGTSPEIETLELEKSSVFQQYIRFDFELAKPTATPANPTMGRK